MIIIRQTNEQLIILQCGELFGPKTSGDDDDMMRVGICDDLEVDTDSLHDSGLTELMVEPTSDTYFNIYPCTSTFFSL